MVDHINAPVEDTDEQVDTIAAAKRHAREKFDELLTFSIPKTCQILGGISRGTLWRLVKLKKLPLPLTISPGRKVFRAIDIEAYVKARQEAAADEYHVTQGKRDVSAAARKCAADHQSKGLGPSETGVANSLRT